MHHFPIIKKHMGFNIISILTCCCLVSSACFGDIIISFMRPICNLKLSVSNNFEKQPPEIYPEHSDLAPHPQN